MIYTLKICCERRQIYINWIQRSIRNKGPLLADMIASHAFDFLCLTETHIQATDSDSFLRSLTPDGFSLIHRPRSSGIGGGVQYNRSRLRRQIGWCNRLANRDKTVYYRKLISDNSHDLKKLWRELHKVLHRSQSTTLPSCESSKSLADRFATFFSNKIMKKFFFI